MYDEEFYATIRAGVQSSAAVVVPIVMDLLKPQHVVDVGCGEGWWGHAFMVAGCTVIGIDGPGAAVSTVLPERFVLHDLTESLITLGITGADLVVCLEVAEHLPPDRADSFIADLCALAPTVLFSAAIPGQGGTGHLNERWPGFWVDLFESHGYAVSGALRWMIWDDDRVDNWYRQNLLVAARDPDRYPAVFDTPTAPPWAVVHPVLYDARRPR